MMIFSDPVPLLLLLFSSLLLTLLAMPLVIRLAHRIGAVDKPDERKVHAKTMPRMGGLGFAIGLVVLPLTMVSSSLHPVVLDLAGFLIGLFVVVLSGMADDIKGISPKLKFIGLGISSLLFVLITDTGIASLGDLFGLGVVETGWLAIPITVGAMVGFVNALNLSDGLDGLAAGIALIAVFFLGFFSVMEGDALTLVLSVTLMGGMLGFLYFNSHPAKVFMGDTGSLVLGYVLGAIALLLIKQAQESADSLVTPVIMGVLLALPLGDTLYVMGKRIREGKSPFLPDKTHFHHRLMALGLPHNGVVGTFYALMLLYGIVATLLLKLPAWLQLAGLLVLLGGTYLVLHLVERSGLRFHIDESAQADRNLGGRHTSNWFARVSGTSVQYATWIIPLLLLYPVVTLEVVGYMKLLVAAGILLALVLFPWESRHSFSWRNGLYYLLVFIPILSIHWFADAQAKDFLWWATLLLAAWLCLKLYFHGHSVIFLTTGLEVLLVSLSWVGPWLTIEFGLVGETQYQALYMASLQSVVFLLATKIVLRRQTQRNRQLFYSLLLLNGLLLV